MTATQVFLRFIESEYKDKEGNIDVKKFRAWMHELRFNRLCSERVPYTLRKRRRISKTFVDDFLCSNGFTLNGYARHFFEHITDCYIAYLYGNNYTQAERNVSKIWRKFLADNINESYIFKKAWTEKKKFDLTWKN